MKGGKVILSREKVDPFREEQDGTSLLPSRFIGSPREPHSGLVYLLTFD